MSARVSAIELIDYSIRECRDTLPFLEGFNQNAVKDDLRDLNVMKMHLVESESRSIAGLKFEAKGVSFEVLTNIYSDCLIVSHLVKNLSNGKESIVKHEKVKEYL